MKRYKVNVQVTGYIEFEETTEQVSLFDEEKVEQISEAQYWFLKNHTNLPDDVINVLSGKLAHELIGRMKQRERERQKETFTESMNRQTQQALEGQPRNDFDDAPEIPLTVKEELAKRICKAQGCFKPAVVKGLCNKHYQIEYKKKGGE